MATISSPGLGSGLDVNGLVSKLIAAEGQPANYRLDNKEAKLQARLSAWGSIKGALSSFQSTLAALKNSSTFSKRSATVSDLSVLSVSTTSIASAGKYAVEVSQLAKAPALASAGSYASINDSVGTGTLTFRFGAWSGSAGSYAFTQNAAKAEKSIVIDASNNTLAGMRDAINNANFGVKASIVNDGTGYRLALSGSDTGASNGIELSVSGGSGGLDNFAFDAVSRNDLDLTNNMVQNIAAQDANLTINGLAITSASNTVSSAISGVTLTLKKESSGTPVTLDVAQDKASVTKAVNDFVDGYNKLADTIKGIAGYDAASKQGGILIGDATVRSIQNQLRNMISTAIGSGSYRSLADIGVATDASGKLAVNSSKLDSALNNGFDDIAGLFAVHGKASDPLIAYNSSTAATRAGTYSVAVSHLAQQGNFSGAAITTPLVFDGSNNTFSLRVDGVATQLFTLDNASYTNQTELEGLAAQLQSKINGDSALSAKGLSVAVIYDALAGRFSITSASYGANSSVEVTSNNATLGLDGSGVSTVGSDVAGEIAGSAALGSGRYLSAPNGAASEGLKIEVLGGALGSRGEITFSRGIAEQLDTLLEKYLASDGIVQARANGTQTAIDDIQRQRELLSERLIAMEARYRKQFTALDGLLASLQGTSNYLATQLASLPGAAK